MEAVRASVSVKKQPAPASASTGREASAQPVQPVQPVQPKQKQSPVSEVPTATTFRGNVGPVATPAERSTVRSVSVWARGARQDKAVVPDTQGSRERGLFGTTAGSRSGDKGPQVCSPPLLVSCSFGLFWALLGGWVLPWFSGIRYGFTPCPVHVAASYDESQRRYL